jgi:hypothetical protein
MSELDDFIRTARNGLDPQAADCERVWSRLSARVGGAGAALAIVTKASASAATTGSLLAGESLGTLAKLFATSFALTLAGAGTVVGVTRLASNAEPPASSGPSVVPARDRAPSREAAVIRAAPAPEASESPPTASAEAAQAAPGSSMESDPPQLSRELALLREVRRASTNREHGRAQALLDRLDQEHPEGALLEERAALRAVVACESASVRGDVRARDFLRRYPTSVYAAKVRRVCPEDTAPGQPAEGATKSFTELDEPGH